MANNKAHVLTCPSNSSKSSRVFASGYVSTKQPFLLLLLLLLFYFFFFYFLFFGEIEVNKY